MASGPTYRASLGRSSVPMVPTVWSSSRAGTWPVLVEDDLVVTDIDAGSLVGLDPLTGRERWRRRIADADDEPLVARALAAGANLPAAQHGATTPMTTLPNLDSHLARTVVRPGEKVLAVARSGDVTYVYVSTPGATGPDEGTLVKLEAGAVRWTIALPVELGEQGAPPSMVADGDAIVIAGGEQIGVIEAADGRLRWRVSVADLGKSRGYTLPGSAQRVAITDSLVYLSATPER
jgi:outer membrane protein assembly factor BamB